jgi:hypothetical protein
MYFDFLEVRDLFRLWREENVRKSVEVVDLWERLLQKKMHKLGDESKSYFFVTMCNVHKSWSEHTVLSKQLGLATTLVYDYIFRTPSAGTSVCGSPRLQQA